jgi:hypothetical protein
VLTPAGTVNASGALNFKMVAELGGGTGEGRCKDRVDAKEGAEKAFLL